MDSTVDQLALGLPSDVGLLPTSAAAVHIEHVAAVAVQRAWRNRSAFMNQKRMQPAAGSFQEALPEGRMDPEDAFPETQLPPLLMVGVEAENPSVSAQQADQELQDTAMSGSAEEHATNVKVAHLQRTEQEVVRLAIQAPIERRLQEVEFDFNLDHDRPKQVSAEIIKALNLSEDELEQISRSIADDARRRRTRGSSGDLGGVVAPEVVQPARMHSEARLEQLGCWDEATGPPAGSPTWGPGSEAQDCPQEPADRLTEGAPRDPRINKDDSEDSSEEGRVLGLLLLGDSEEKAIRKGLEKLRVFSSPPPPEQSRKEGGDNQSPRQQTPRQGTAEVPGTVRTARTEPMESMPVSESVATSPPFPADGATRSSTGTAPSSSSREEGEAATPTPAAERQGVSLLPPRSPVPRVPLVTKGFDSSHSDSSLAGEPVTSSEGLSSRGVPSSPRVRPSAAANSVENNRGNIEDRPAASAGAGAGPCAQQQGASPEPSEVVRAAMATPVCKPLSLPSARRGRSQQAFNLGTPRERGVARKPSTPREQVTSRKPSTPREQVTSRKPSTPREQVTSRKPSTPREQLAARNPPPTPARITAGLAPSKKGGVIPMSPIIWFFGDRRRDSLFEKAGANPTKIEGNGGGEGGEGGNSAVPADEDEAAETWLEHRTHGLSASDRRDSFRRRGSQRYSRSSSWDDASIGSFRSQQAMFSPGRFNPTSSALSWGGVDDSVLGSSVRSFTSSRGPSERTFAPPQLSESEKAAVEQLKIKRSDVNFGYHTLGDSKRVYKIELNGKMRAAKVINTLGMTRDEMAEMRETFDAELLALSRLDTPHIVKVYGASVSPAEVIVVSEFVEGGVLRKLLHDPRKLKSLTLRMRLGIAEDIALGMKSLYSHGMQHRHLTSNSVVLTSDYRAKILGVGLAMTTELIGYFEGEERADKQAEEELPWTSREVLAGAGFSQKSDVYSFGITLWEIMQKEPCLPYAGLVPTEVVRAKYNGEGPPIPEDCPPAIGRLMKSCWSNLPSSRPSFDKICDTLEAAEGWLEEDGSEGLAGTGASPLYKEQQSRTTIVSPLQEVEEPSLEVDESVVGSPDAGGSGGPTPSGTTEATSGVAITQRFFADIEPPTTPPAATPAATPPATPSAATSAAHQDQDLYQDLYQDEDQAGFLIGSVPMKPMSEAIVPMSSSGTGESSNSLNDRTAVRIDAAIQAAMAIAGTSSKFDVPRSKGRFNAVGGGGGGGGRSDTSYKDLTTHPGSGSGGSRASGSETSTKSSAVVTRESKKATTEARLDAAIRAALVIHATDRSSSGSSSTLQGSINADYGASLALVARRGDGRGDRGMVTVYQPPAPPRLRGHRPASREGSSSGYYGDTSGGDGGARQHMPLTDSNPASGRARENRSGIGVRAGVNMAVQALASARKAEAHQADAAAARLQRLKEQQRSRRRRQRERDSRAERPYRPREADTAALDPQRIAEATVRGQARAQVETRARAETFARERVLQDEQALVKAYRAPAAAKAGPQAAAYGSRAVGKNSSWAMQGTAGTNTALLPTVAGDRFLPETSIGAARGGSQRQPWDNIDDQKAGSSGALAH